MTGDPWRRLFAQARRRGGGSPWQSVPPQDGDSLGPRRLAAPWPRLPSRLHVAVSPAPGERGRRSAGGAPALRSCARGWNPAGSCQRDRGEEGEALVQGSGGPRAPLPRSPRSCPLLLRDGACGWRERVSF